MQPVGEDIRDSPVLQVGQDLARLAHRFARLLVLHPPERVAHLAQAETQAPGDIAAQDQQLGDDAAVRRAVTNATQWLLAQGYRNVLVEIANECDNRRYEQPLIQAPRIHELIGLVKSTTGTGRRLPVSASFNGGTVPHANVVAAADFLLLHGNGVSDPDRIARMVQETRKVSGYRPMPILFNEDDHFDFDKPRNNFIAAVGEYASWGYFDFRMKGKDSRRATRASPSNWITRHETRLLRFAQRDDRLK